MKEESNYVYVEPAYGKDVFEWTRRARIITFDGYVPPLYPDRVYDATKLVNLARKLEANVIRISMMGKLAHFNTNEWEVDDYIKNHDFLQEIIYLAHASGIRVVPYLPGAVHLPFDLLMKWHPDWIQKEYYGQPPEDTPMVNHSGTVNGMPCPIGGYRKFYISMLEETVLKHDVDGIYSDAWKEGYFNDVCYCDSCRINYLKDTGNDLSLAEFSAGGLRVGELKKWYKEKLIQMVQETHAMVRSVKRIPTIINGIHGVLGYQSQGSWGNEIDVMHDVLHFERKTEPYDRLVSASYLNLLGTRAWFYAGLYSPLQFNGPEGAEEDYADERIFPYRKELYNESFITYACGQAVNNIRVNSLLYDTESPGGKITAEINRIVKENPQDSKYKL